MTNKELRDELAEFPDDMEVWFTWTDYSGYTATSEESEVFRTELGKSPVAEKYNYIVLS